MKKKLGVVVLLAGLMVFSTAMGITSYAAEGTIASSNDNDGAVLTRSDDIGYQTRVYNGRRQRRLYNFTTGTPLSDWEYY